VIIIKNKKLLLSLGLFLVSFLFTGCALFNSAPVIESNAVTTATEGALYTYGVDATDPEGDELVFTLSIHPDGMTINSSTGVISWTPASAGSYDVTVEVSDPYRSTTQSFTITVDETILTSIVVLPATMTIPKNSSKNIDSVTAHYSNGTEANITPLSSCTYTSDKPTKVSVSASGLIKGIASCTGANAAIITVSYTEGEVTEEDTVIVTVPG
jgi:hypothetical protein